MRERQFYLRAAGIVLLAVALTGCETGGPGLSVKGRVVAGGVPVSGSSVTLYAAGTIISETLGYSTTDKEGNFSIKFNKPSESGIIYAVARGGKPEGSVSANEALAFLTVIGEVNDRPGSVTLNEITTIASVWTYAQFLNGSSIVGNGTGIYNAAANVRNIANIETGGPGPVIQNAVNGSRTNALPEVNTLGNIVHTCASLSHPDACASLFSASAPPGWNVPEDTLSALHNIALNPWWNVTGIFSLAPPAAPYFPALNTAPAAWTIALKFTGGGLDAPGAVSIDEDGNVWATNDLLYGPQPELSACGDGGSGVTKLTPDGYPLSSALGFKGGGLNGAAYGLAVDQTGNVWIGNYHGGGVSLLTPDGSPLSPDVMAYRAGGNAGRVQGTIVDYEGNVWFVNSGPSSACQACGNTLTLFPGGDPDNAVTFAYPGTDTLNEPYGVALDLDGEIWITNAGGNTVTRIDSLGNPDFQSEAECCGISGPRGIAIDSIGNVWIANLTDPGGSEGGSVTLLDPFGSNAPGSPFRDGGIRGAWGIAVDGADNVWVANFIGGTITNLCGVTSESCPQGYNTGDPISPSSGYDGGGALQHPTAVAIDQAGNVWAANNVNDLEACLRMSESGCPQASNECEGDGLVVFYGLATPVDAPLIGPPRQP